MLCRSVLDPALVALGTHCVFHGVHQRIPSMIVFVCGCVCVCVCMLLFLIRSPWHVLPGTAMWAGLYRMPHTHTTHTHTHTNTPTHTHTHMQKMAFFLHTQKETERERRTAPFSHLGVCFPPALKSPLLLSLTEAG